MTCTCCGRPARSELCSDLRDCLTAYRQTARVSEVMARWREQTRRSHSSVVSSSS